MLWIGKVKVKLKDVRVGRRADGATHGGAKRGTRRTEACVLRAFRHLVTHMLKAILGPTNTGKTHLAIERMCAHSSGMIGFPLRLLAREVYDRVVAIKGERSVALITGEEKIVPADARYFLSTAESMPSEKDVAFVALDEAQIGIDPERGHVFTDRMLGARGREETLILGSEALRPMVRSLLPKAEIVTRPRFSTLSYGGMSKLSRLPPRSAIVAFSAEEVYAVAEMLRRFRGGAAVVMGALSPRTRNAQVAMYQAGEVDYIVATDAIGMGLNMDVHHVAFASLSKFDGRRSRRLHLSEMAQIAGRAGRHQRDGTFGTLHLGGGKSPEFTEEEVEAIGDHRFPPLDHLFWRNSSPDFSGVDQLIESLCARPRLHGLRPAPEAVDLAVLKAIADDPDVRARAKSLRTVKRLWAVCGLPDFRKSGPVHHAQLVRRLFNHLTEGAGHVPHQWFADQVQRLDNVAGDIEAIADRIAGVRTWAYIAHRPDWLAEPELWADRTREVEQRLSDALHTALTQRFVSRRTAVLLRDLGAKGADTLPMIVAADGEVSVGDEPIGRLDGFSFVVDPSARHSDRRMLLAAAERKLGTELERRAAALVADADEAFAVDDEAVLSWRGHPVARLVAGRRMLQPRAKLSSALERLSRSAKAAVEARLMAWTAGRLARKLGALAAIDVAARDAATPPPVRALLAMIVDGGGVVARAQVADALVACDRDMRRAATQLGIRIGALDLFVPAALKLEALRWRSLLLGLAKDGEACAAPAGQPVAVPVDAAHARRLVRLGYRDLGVQMLRVDMAERLATHAHRATGDDPVDRALTTSLGLSDASVTKLMADVGFRCDPSGRWRFRGRAHKAVPAAPPRPGNAFAALAELKAAEVRTGA